MPSDHGPGRGVTWSVMQQLVGRVSQFSGMSPEKRCARQLNARQLRRSRVLSAAFVARFS